MNDWHFDGKVAIVTGGASGIGFACSVTLARGGARVVIADINEQSGSRAVSDITREGGQAIFTRTDVGRHEDVEAMVEAAVQDFGRLDIAVNNAGIGGEPAPTGRYSIEGWQKVININLNSVFYCMRYEIPRMLETGGGSIVNMASILGTVGFANSPAYTAAKHGIVGLTKTAALEYADNRIRVNAVCPGYIETKMTEDTMRRRGEQLMAMVPFHRMGKPEEIAELVVWLCSERASYVSGAAYNVDGGYMAI